MKFRKLLKNKNFHDIVLILVVPILFLIIGTWTIKDYGFNWDEPYHFMRGQAYLHFLMTGEKDYSSLEKYPRLSSGCPDWAKGYCDISPGGATDTVLSINKAPTYGEETERLQEGRDTKRSFYQHDIYTFNEIINVDEGHPPASDILSSFTNYIFYQKLGIVGDLESYHLFEVFSAFLLVVAVAFIVYKEFGILPSIVSSTFIASYPLFFAESHFNIKDPVLTSFYGITIILFYLGVKQKKMWNILMSGVFLGLATGVKFNTVFLPFILIPWFLYFFIVQYLSRKTKKQKKDFVRSYIFIIGVVLFMPLLAFFVFYSLWPFLWTDTVVHLMEIVTFYKSIGTGTPGEMLNYIKNGWNTYPIIWIIYTTPIPILLFSILGFFKSLKLIFQKSDFSVLVLLWLFIPILRVSWPGSSLYGGVRQIMEYIPALAILAGIGVFALIEYVKKFRKNNKLLLIISYIAIFVSLTFTVYDVAKIHPNENVYFNQLIGGLSGARDKDVPYWGNTYGNVYMQGVKWLNENAEPNAKLGLAVTTMGNLPKLQLRADIDFYNGHWSGKNREGEYLIELDFNWMFRRFYSFQYMEVFLEPVYVVEVDGVPLLKIWKNDIEHTRDGYEKEQMYKFKEIQKIPNGLFIDIGQGISFTRVDVSHSSFLCEQVNSGYISTSLDGVNWERDPEGLIAQVPPVVKDFNDNNFVYLSPAKQTRYIKIEGLDDNSCLHKYFEVKITGL